MIFGEALAAREPNDMTFLPDPYNIGVDISFLSSVTLISNIVLITAESFTGERIKKGPPSNEENLPNNDEVETILIGDFCVFEKQWSTFADINL